MKLVCCVDLKNGIQFNKRRLTTDKEIISIIEEEVNKSSDDVWCKEYSRELFENPMVFDDISDLPVTGEDFVFLEDNDVNKLLAEEDDVDEILLFKWNKVYPSDTKLELTSSVINQFKVVESNHITTTLHEVIFERWRKK